MGRDRAGILHGALAFIVVIAIALLVPLHVVFDHLGEPAAVHQHESDDHDSSDHEIMASVVAAESVGIVSSAVPPFDVSPSYDESAPLPSTCVNSVVFRIRSREPGAKSRDDSRPTPPRAPPTP